MNPLLQRISIEHAEPFEDLSADVNMQIRIETFNIFNVRLNGAPNGDPTNPTFGVVNTSSQINFARTTQLGVRFQF